MDAIAQMDVSPESLAKENAERISYLVEKENLLEQQLTRVRISLSACRAMDDSFNRPMSQPYPSDDTPPYYKG